MNVFDSYIDAGQNLSQRDKERYYTALLEYLKFGKEPQVSGAVKAIFTAIWPTLRESRTAYVNGSKGGRPRKTSDAFCEKPKTKTAKTEKPKTQICKNQNSENEETQTQNCDKPNSKGNSKEKDMSKDISKKKEPKHKNGANQNVLLTDEELEKLKERFPDWQRRIDDLSYYIASTGKTYSSHYMTILNWARADEPRGGATDGRFEKFRD